MYTCNFNFSVRREIHAFSALIRFLEYDGVDFTVVLDSGFVSVSWKE